MRNREQFNKLGKNSFSCLKLLIKNKNWLLIISEK